jgi:hypothetical protein
MDQQLIPSVDVERLIAARALCAVRLTDIAALLAEADSVLDDLGVGVGMHSALSRALTHCIRYHYTDLRSERVRDKVLHQLDADLWGTLMHRSGMRTHLSAKLRREWSEQLQRGQHPAFEVDAIKGTFGDLFARKGEILEDAVIELYRSLSWNYKTNQPSAFGKRLFTRADRDAFDDLERFFHLFDGKTEPDHRSSIGRHFPTYHCPERKFMSGPYFDIQTYKKGSAKVTFWRDDIVDKMNAILAKRYPGALPSPRTARRHA